MGKIFPEFNKLLSLPDEDFVQEVTSNPGKVKQEINGRLWTLELLGLGSGLIIGLLLGLGISGGY